MDANKDSRCRAWSAYWSSGRLHSCATSFQDNYAGSIGHFWSGLAARLRPGIRMLDLAAGNGPLSLLMWEKLHGRLQIDAVDLAEVAPAWYETATHEGVRFHAGVNMEALPFADGHFDLIVSQFGLEYADQLQALAECMRVANGHATFAFVMHHSESVLVRVGREELSHHDLLAAEGGLLSTAREVIPWIERVRAGGTGDSAMATRMRDRYNRAMRELAQVATASSAPDLLLEARDTVHGLVARVGSEGAAQPALDALETYSWQLKAGRLRTSEMVASALDLSQLDAFAQRFAWARPGSAIACSELRQEEGVLAWSFMAGPAAVDVVDPG
jgi:hypothetical protein